MLLSLISLTFIFQWNFLFLFFSLSLRSNLESSQFLHHNCRLTLTLAHFNFAIILKQLHISTQKLPTFWHLNLYQFCSADFFLFVLKVFECIDLDRTHEQNGKVTFVEIVLPTWISVSCCFCSVFRFGSAYIVPYK